MSTNIDKIETLKKIIKTCHEYIDSIYRNCPHKFEKVGDRIGIEAGKFEVKHGIGHLSMSSQKFRFTKLECMSCGFTKEERGEAVAEFWRI